VAKAKKNSSKLSKGKRASPVTRNGHNGSAGSRNAGAEGCVPLDRRVNGERRGQADRRKADVPVAVERRKLERRAKVTRRRQIDPTTCERDYTAEEIEFMNAMDQYKRSSGRMFPTCSEILEVVRKLGYEKRARDDNAPPLHGITVADVFQPQQAG
jgi:hypothetical protein